LLPLHKLLGGIRSPLLALRKFLGLVVPVVVFDDDVRRRLLPA